MQANLGFKATLMASWQQATTFSKHRSALTAVNARVGLQSLSKMAYSYNFTK